jgi:hypothetical protein
MEMQFPGEVAFCKTPLPPDPHPLKLLEFGGSRWSPLAGYLPRLTG